MGRRKIINDPYAIAVKKERRKRIIQAPIDVTYEGGFKPGNIVIVTSKTTFIGSAIGAVLEPQKWCDAGIPVASSHESYTRICVRIQNGDTIVKISK
jgi:hypothetical protein